MTFSACNTTEPNNSQNISFSVEDVSCTEAWLKLETKNISLPLNITLTNNNTIEQIIKLSKPDTIIYVDSLLPNKTYSFQISDIGDPVSGIRSNKVSVTTLDTTSHNFTWQTFTFGGEAGSCNLFGVAIIDENNIWAVGEIYLKDSTGQPDTQPYGVAHWNGKAWNIKKLFHNANIPVTPRGILVLSQEEIYLAAGSIFKWNGTSSEVDVVFSRLSLSDPDGTIEKLWGNSNSPIYGVGNNGCVTFYKNGNWTKIESGTDVRLTDIYGTPDGKNIWACGWDNRGITTVLEIEKNEVKILYDSQTLLYPYIGNLNGLWSDGSEFIVAGSLVFRHSVYYKKQVKSETVPTGNGYKLFEPGNFVFSVRGNGKNNIFIGGDNIMLWHFNGIGWHKYEELYSSTGRIYSIAIKNDIVSAVGNLGTKAWITIGKR